MQILILDFMVIIHIITTITDRGRILTIIILLYTLDLTITEEFTKNPLSFLTNLKNTLTKH